MKPDQCLEESFLVRVGLQVDARLRIDRSVAIVAAVLLVAVSACAEEDTDVHDPNSYAVGLLLPYTGGDAAVGTNYERAALMARDAINEAGGINGKPIHFVSKDTHSTLDRARKSLDEILEHDVVAVIGPEGAEIAKAVMPQMHDNEVLFMSPVISGASDIDLPSDYLWVRLAPSPSILGRRFANYLFEDQGAHQLGLAYSDDEYNRDFIEALSEQYTQLGGVILASLPLAQDQGSFTEEVAEAQDVGTTNIVLAASAKLAARFVNEVTSSRDTSWQWYLSPVLESPIFLQNTSPKALEGALGIGFDVYDRSDEYVERYRKRWGDDPLDGTFFYHDSLMLMALALEMAVDNGDDEIEYPKVRSAIEQIAFPAGITVGWQQLEKGLGLVKDGRTIYYSGLTGTVFLDRFGQQRGAPMKTWAIRDGQIVRDEIL